MPIQVGLEVRKVIAEIKGFDIGRVKPEKTLEELDYSTMGARNLAQELNLHFYIKLNLMFDSLLHGRDISKGDKVSAVIALVKSLNPRPRG